MNQPSLTPQERYAMLAEEFRCLPDITLPVDGAQSKKQFGSSALKVKQKIFAMLVEGKLVVKLPKQRVDALVVSGVGEPFDPRHDGRLMKEWVSVEPTTEERWLELAREAMEFVASGR
jgi:TfoX/Sxy family transcriptional regulator of competence genes